MERVRFFNFSDFAVFLKPQTMLTTSAPSVVCLAFPYQAIRANHPSDETLHHSGRKGCSECFAVRRKIFPLAPAIGVPFAVSLGITGGVLMRPIDPRYLEAARKIRSRDRLATTTKIFPGWLCTASRFELPTLELLLSSPKVSQLVNRHPDQRKRERLKLLIQ